MLDEDLLDQTHSSDDIITIDLPIMLGRRGNGMRIVIDSPYVQPEPDPSLIDLISRAHIYLDRPTERSAMKTTTIAEAFNVDRADVGRILPLAFLSRGERAAIRIANCGLGFDYPPLVVDVVWRA